MFYSYEPYYDIMSSILSSIVLLICLINYQLFSLSAGTVEYTDDFPVEKVRFPFNECLGYDTKQSDGEVPVMLELGGI